MKKNTTTMNLSKKQVTPKPQPREELESADPVLRFTPYAWAKLYWFCHHGETEIGGFGVTTVDDPLLIEDFVTVKQATTCVSISFDDEAVADFFEAQVDAGRKPEQFARIWAHTHPGASPLPSATDEETFSRVFGNCHWAVMFILAAEGKTYARLRFNVGPKGHSAIPVEIDYTQPFAGSAHETWLQEYVANIHPEPFSFAPMDPIQSDQAGWKDTSLLLDPTVEQEELELLARTRDMSPDELENFFEQSEVWL